MVMLLNVQITRINSINVTCDINADLKIYKSLAWIISEYYKQ